MVHIHGGEHRLSDQINMQLEISHAFETAIHEVGDHRSIEIGIEIPGPFL